MFDLILFRDKQYRSYIILAVIITLAIAWTNFGHNTGDEYSQIFEYAGYKLGYVNYADIRLAEFDGHMRPSIQVWMVIAVYKLVGLFCTQVNPFVVNYIIYVFSGLLSIVAVVLFSQLVIEQIDVKLRKWFVIFSLFSWLVLYTSVHFNSDSICGKFFLIGLFFVLENKNQASYIKLFCGGLLFALAFACRFQIGFAIAGVMVYWLVVAIRQRAGYLNIVIITLAILLGIFIFNIVADYYFYGTWVFSPYGYYYYNIATGTMSGFGVSPWYTYFLMVAGYLPFGPFYVLASFYYIYKKPKSIYTTIILSYCILHIIIGHKEVRFLMPMLVFMPLVVFILLQDMLVKYTWVKHNINWIIKTLWSLNMLACLSLLIPAATEVGGWRFLYDNYNKPTIVYYNFENNMKLLYYKKPNVKLQHIDATQDLAMLTCPTGYNCLLALKDSSKLGVVNYHLVYTFFPIWLYVKLPANINNSIGHFNIYQIKTIEN